MIHQKGAKNQTNATGLHNHKAKSAIKIRQELEPSHFWHDYIPMKTFGKYIVGVLVILAVVLGIARFHDAGQHFMPVSLICYGFLIGYLAAWFHIGHHQGFSEFSRFLDDAKT
jgi:hypothetical protein